MNRCFVAASRRSPHWALRPGTSHRLSERGSRMTQGLLKSDALAFELELSRGSSSSFRSRPPNLP
jgi:hypothetical protein